MENQNNSEQQNFGGLWDNIRNKQDRIAGGSGEKPAKKGSPDYPKADAFKKASKASKKK